MSSIKKHLYTVLPRVAGTSSSQVVSPRPRSQSVSSPRTFYTSSAVLPLSFFDSPPQAPLRPVPSPHRLPQSKSSEAEGPNAHPPLSLALTAPSSATNPNFSLAPSHQQKPLFPCPGASTRPPHSTPAGPRRQKGKRTRMRYHLDVGAYGMPKHYRPPSHRHIPCQDDLYLSVQVGEDAYFVRDNAMGVADGVGGWSCSKANDINHPTPSALFARRLMHFCSAELDSVSTDVCLSTPTPSSSVPLSDRGSSQTLHNSAFLPFSAPWPCVDSLREFETRRAALGFLRESDLHDDHACDDHNDFEADPFEELKDGIDVLKILERAYVHSINAHVVPIELPLNSGQAPAASKPSHSIAEATKTPLLTGSSTALLAVLDHLPALSKVTPAITSGGTSEQANQPRQSESNISAMSISKDRKGESEHLFNFSGLLSTFTPVNGTHATQSHRGPRSYPLSDMTGTGTCPDINGQNGEENYTSEIFDAVLKVAHIGDSMGMIVRGDDIVWRSEEMWWDFNTPVQLGTRTCVPSTTSSPHAIISDELSRQSTQKEASHHMSASHNNYSSSTSYHPQDSSSPLFPAIVKSNLFTTVNTPRTNATKFAGSSRLFSASASTSADIEFPIAPVPVQAHTYTVPVKKDDILILASDGLSDNLWDEDILDEVVRFRKAWPTGEEVGASQNNEGCLRSEQDKVRIGSRVNATHELLRRRTFVGMLSEALCSRARNIAGRRGELDAKLGVTGMGKATWASGVYTNAPAGQGIDSDEVPFARRAREAGKRFRGGKQDDISVIVAVVSPAA